MARTRTWADIRATLAADARRNRTAFVMTAWGGLLSIPMLIGLAVMLIGGLHQWLGNTLAVLVVLYIPPGLYFSLRDRPNRGIKKRPYRPVSVADHEGANGVLRTISWRWAVVAGTAGAMAAWVALTSSLIVAVPNTYLWWMGIGLLGAPVAAVFLIAVVQHPMMDRALLRLQAGLEFEHPNATFAIFKSAQVCSEIACADPTSAPTAWNDNTSRAVVTFDGDGIRVWDQSWGNRMNAATIPWSRVESLKPAIARVRWRYIRGVELRLISQPGEPDVGVVLPPARSQRCFRPLDEVEYGALCAQLEEHVKYSKAQEDSTVVPGELGH
ncbi:hypothetical protein [Cryobacterium glucosi]|uniref:Uncharacterized protein n=1 Tax=Cryobacterium glucosi TaxID=1259175 RepID=A0ABY2IKV9_9MICO|nr:hypothetical protein [Cryobacterium glucosi]TFC19470.1 hypothetical protein E3O46_11940 [Cryobacterium glucosi]